MFEQNQHLHAKKKKVVHTHCLICSPFHTVTPERSTLIIVTSIMHRSQHSVWHFGQKDGKFLLREMSKEMSPGEERRHAGSRTQALRHISVIMLTSGSGERE